MDFKQLFDFSRSTHTLASIERLLFWDQETMMPTQGIDIKTMQKKELAALIHHRKTSKEYEKLLSQFIALDSGEILNDQLNDDQKRSLELMREDYHKMKKLPVDFITEFAEVTSKATHVWIEARQNDDFELFAPHLSKIIDHMKKKADLLGYINHPYDPLLDEYEPQITTQTIDSLFDPLKKALIDLTQQLSHHSIPDQFLYGSFDRTAQFSLNTGILNNMGLDPKKVRLDQSAHPFCMPIHPTDIRLTTHVQDAGFYQGFSATMHEGGHGLYEQGLDPDFFGLPLAEAASIGIHESQSKLWETFIGQSFSFWKGYYPIVQETFKEQFENISLDSFFHAINAVRPSLIRIHADEVTYGLHVILRYEIEKAFMEGKLSVYELPEFWNAKMHEYLGIVPHTNAQGCMQDIHWASGLFGYFPTYALGNLYAAQLHHTMLAAFPDYNVRLENRDFKFIREWLLQQVHRHGRRYYPQQLIEKATKKKLAVDDFLSYLNKKYLPISARA
ncbi:MAG: carboxypeptidase M32 [Simkaniaceae bacterium]|nr:carboxypeptidase M32 [Simkaniaceae bacterium]